MSVESSTPCQKETDSSISQNIDDGCCQADMNESSPYKVDLGIQVINTFLKMKSWLEEKKEHGRSCLDLL